MAMAVPSTIIQGLGLWPVAGVHGDRAARNKGGTLTSLPLQTGNTGLALQMAAACS